MSLRVFARSRWTIVLAVALWIPAVGYGLSILWTYASTPGRAAQPPLAWPRHAPIALNPDGDTLLMFVHPRCPCSDASIGELAILMAHSSARLDARLDARLFFFYPHQERAQW